MKLFLDEVGRRIVIDCLNKRRRLLEKRTQSKQTQLELRTIGYILKDLEGGS